MILATRILTAKTKLPLPNLSGASSWELDTIFPAGTYKVTIRGGAGYHYAQGNINGVGFTQTVTVAEPFIIRAYCGSSATAAPTAGTNPSTHTLKRNASLTTSVPTSGGMFGGAGGTKMTSSTSGGGGTLTPLPGGSNCLGNGNVWGSSYASGAGSCCHFLPVGGTFGTNYLFCFHAASGAIPVASGRANNYAYAGAGGAYGGGGGAGRSMTPTAHYGYGYAGGAGTGGNGGAGGGTSITAGATAGSNGSGVGSGEGGRGGANVGNPPLAGVAFYNGSSWVNPTRIEHGLQGCIIVEQA